MSKDLIPSGLIGSLVGTGLPTIPVPGSIPPQLTQGSAPAPNTTGGPTIVQGVQTALNIFFIVRNIISFANDTIRQLQESDNENLRQLGAYLEPTRGILEFIENRLQAIRELLLRAAGPIANIFRSGEAYQQANQEMNANDDVLEDLWQRYHGPNLEIPNPEVVGAAPP